MVARHRLKKPTEQTMDHIRGVMQKRYGAWLSEIIAPDLFLYTSRHQRFHVWLLPSQTAIEVNSFHEVIELSRPGIDPIPGA